MRQPAAHQAVFGIRPSRGALSLEGTVVIHEYDHSLLWNCCLY